MGLSLCKKKVYYSVEEINKHKSENNLWIISGNKVYDITFFLEKHPGGKNSILKNMSENCKNHYNFHSKKGKKEWEKYLIGYIF